MNNHPFLQHEMTKLILSWHILLTDLFLEMIPYVLHVSKSWFGEVPCQVTATGMTNSMSVREKMRITIFHPSFAFSLYEHTADFDLL
jgi:hypothetical protein